MVDSVSRFLGFADSYDRARPWPPPELPELLCQWAGISAPDVVDLGAGSGHSAVLWAGHAGHVTAVEPGRDMRTELARRVTALPDPALVDIVDGTAEDTGLPAGCADIVTASQAMHWFDPDRALPEIARLLRPGGVFAAYDCDWPPATHAEVDAAYRDFARIVYTEERSRGLLPPHAGKDRHLARLADSGLFAFTHEICLHHKESGDAERMAASARTLGGAVALLADGMTEEELGLTALDAAARRRMPTPIPWYWTFRIRLAVR